MKEIYGDLIELGKNNVFDVIVHGCNCFCTMGSGIAKQIKLEFPEAYKADLDTVKGDKSKLGTISVAVKILLKKNLYIVNAYTQYYYNPRFQQTDYQAVRNCFKQIKQQFGNKGIKFGIPLIGAGLGGGDWKIISLIIGEEMENEDLTLVRFFKN